MTLRALLVTPDYPPSPGGVQRLLHHITSAMPDAETTVVTMRSEGAESFDASTSQRVVRVPRVARQQRIQNATFNLSALAASMRLGGWRPDIVLNGHVVTGPASVALSRRFSAPCVTYTYGKEVAGRPGMTAWSVRRSVATVAVSGYTRDQVLSATGPDAGDSVHVIHPGVEPPTEPGAADAETPTIVTVSRLRDYYKGHDIVLKALPKVREAIEGVRWIVIGDGRARADLEARARDTGLGDTVTFLGAVDDETREEWMARAHVFAMPARYPRDEIGGEGFPVVYLEAAAWGLPALAGNVGGPAEAVLDGQTGRTVDPESPSEVADALIDLLSDPARARSMGLAARERVTKSFTWDVVAGQLNDLLSSAVKRAK